MYYNILNNNIKSKADFAFISTQFIIIIIVVFVIIYF